MRSLTAVRWMLVLAASVGLAAAGGLGHRTPTDPDVVGAFEDLRAVVAGLPATVIGRGTRTRLSAHVRVSARAYESGKACLAVDRLDFFLAETRRLRGRKGLVIAEDLHNRARVVQRDALAALPADETCPGHENFASEPNFYVAASDNQRLAVRIEFGEAQTWSVEVDGEVFTQAALPGVDPRPGIAGLPGVPVVRSLVAVPRGAYVVVSASPVAVAERLVVNLLPFQPSPGDAQPPVFDEAFEDRPFVKNEDAYASDRLFPEELCTVTPIGQFRDLPLAQLSCAAGRYNPVSDRLDMYTAVDVELQFVGTGDAGAFVTEASLNPFERDTYDAAEATLNHDEVFDYVEASTAQPTCLGEELLIITPQSLRPAADVLAAWKQKKGIATNVFEIDGTTTGDQIDAFIEDRYDQCLVRPSYVLLFGDAELVPTFYVPTLYSSQTASDYRYAVYPQIAIDIVPDFGVGRITVDTLGQANAVVQKIIGYESSPPSASGFFQNVSFASQFQCCRFDVQLAEVPTKGWDQRDFVRTSELVRDSLLSQGYTVERIYTQTLDFKYKATGADQTPRRYYDGSLLPVGLRDSSGFVWDGSTQDVIDAFNGGRFLMLHRDHGSWDKWSHPEFNKSQVLSSLNNGNLLPVLFSINCSSGLFDNETNPGELRPLDPTSPYPSTALPPLGGGPSIASQSYFAEELLRKTNGGAIGILAATRDSPTPANDALTRGFFDAVWPDTLPTHGDQKSRRRLGDILNHGKNYLLTQVGAPQTGDPVSGLDALSDLFLFHVFGDPTLEMWTSAVAFTLPQEHVATILNDRLLVSYAVDGATITALQETDSGLAPVGRATVRDGTAELSFVAAPEAGAPILLSASLTNTVSRLLTPEDEEPAELVDESAFGSSALRLTFDPSEGRSPGEVVTDQYALLGLHFVDDVTRTPTVDDGSGRDRATRSEPHSLLNRTGGDLLVEDPLEILFDAPMQRVGAYIGNFDPGDPGTPRTALLTAYDGAGVPLFTVSRTDFGPDVTTFLGLDVGSARIRKLHLSYGPGTVEEIDDLLVE